MNKKGKGELMSHISLSLLRWSNIAIICFTVTLAGCTEGDVSDSNEIPEKIETLTGVAATGAPISMGTVTLKDKYGRVESVTTDNFGVYSFDLKELSKDQPLEPPFLLKVEPTESDGSDVLYSVAEEVGIVNITPLTNLALREALDDYLPQSEPPYYMGPADFFKYGDIRETIYQSGIQLDGDLTLQNLPFRFDIFPSSSLSPDRLKMANDIVIESFSMDFSEEGIATEELSLFSTPFDANGRGVDAVLDRYVFDGKTVRAVSSASLGEVKRMQHIMTEIQENLFKLPQCKLNFTNNWKEPYCATDHTNRNEWVCDNTDYEIKPYGGLGHTGLDIQTKDVGLLAGALSEDNTHGFYAISQGLVIRAGTFGNVGENEDRNSLNAIAIYDEINDITTLYLHASKIDKTIEDKASINAEAIINNEMPTERVGFGDTLGVQGKEGADNYHVHISFRPGKVINDLNGNGIDVTPKVNDTLDPVTTYYKYYRPENLSSPSIDSIGPVNPVIGASGDQTFIISGSGFIDTTTVVLRDGNNTEYCNMVIVIRPPNTIELEATFGVIADNWTVEVMNNGSSHSDEFAFEVAEPMLPGIPDGVTATPGNGKIVLNWGLVGNASSYDLYYSVTSGQGIAGTKILGVVPPYTHENLVPGTEHFYTVVASNTLGDSLPSVEVSATPTDTNVGIQNLSGSVRDGSSGLGISGARVKVELIHNGENSVIDTFSDIFGNFIFNVDNSELPEYFLVTVSAEGYMPETFDATRDTGAIPFELTRLSENVVVLEIDPILHHLGNDSFSGTTNSQFQKLSEGEFYEKSFNLSERQMQADSVKLSLVAKGVDLADRVLINGLEVGVLIISPSDGSFGAQELEVPVEAFVLGNNTIRIEAVATFDLDDFEFANVILFLLLP